MILNPNEKQKAQGYGHPFVYNRPIAPKGIRWETDTHFDLGTDSDTDVYLTGTDSYVGLEASGATKEVLYTTDTDYSISDSAKIEVDGYAMHIGTAVSAECLNFSRFDMAALDYSKNSGTLAITLDGTYYSVSSSYLNAVAGGYASIVPTNNVTGMNVEGCIRIFYTPLYDRNDAGHHHVINLKKYDNANDHCRIGLSHYNGQNLYLYIKDDAAATILQVSVGDLTLINGTEYEFELNYKFTSDASNTGQVHFYKDGTRIYTKTDVLDCVQTSLGHDYVFLGAWYTPSAPAGRSVHSSKFRQVEMFNAMQHTGASYTPATSHAGYYTTDNLYVTTTNDSQLAITTPLLTAAETATKTNGHLAYMHSVDSRVGWKAGSSWTTPADATLRANADEIDDVNTNISSLATPSDTLDTRIFIKTDSITSKVVLDLLRYTVVAGYSTPGTYTSGVYDSGNIDQEWGKIYYNVDLPVGTTMTVVARASNTSGSGTYSDDLSSGDETYLTGQYMQLKITLATTDMGCTPEVNRIGIRFAPPMYTRDDV